MAVTQIVEMSSGRELRTELAAFGAERKLDCRALASGFAPKPTRTGATDKIPFFAKVAAHWVRGCGSRFRLLPAPTRSGRFRGRTLRAWLRMLLPKID